MHITDILHETLSALLSNKVRTGLTVLGIIIGIASVISMLAIGQGAKNSVNSSIQSIGSNLLMIQSGTQQGPGTMVSSGRGSAKTLKLEDAEAITKELTATVVKAVAADVSGRYQITAKGNNTNTSVVGTTNSYQTIRNVQVAEGAFIADGQVASGARVAVIGPSTRDDLFGKNATGVVGQTIKINKIGFKIIGVTVSKGSSGMSNQDDIIYIPISTAQRLLSGDKYVSTISVSAVDSNSTTQAQEEITALLLKRHKITDSTKADFSIMNQADIASTASSITSIFTILLGAVAGISLVVGGIGIMNMMLTTVTERTREIGLRKAIGAKRRDISLQFLIEAVVLTFLGGFFGVILGWLISFSIAYLGILQAQVSWWSVILAFSVSAIIGIVFGYYPARRAAGLNPIDALRYE
ncbi:MAG: ABC transporter permease [Candidatus Paceibacterota bacterium]|jgi:putative ABC transport system permease protein